MSEFESFITIGRFLLDISWLWLPVVLTIVFFQAWMYYSQRAYWQSIQWILLEIKPPRDIEQSPKIMEQVFAGFWGIFGNVSTKVDKYIRGIIQDYLSFEIAGFNGEIHFFVRTPAKFRNLVEAQIYSQYPQTEIKEVEDYVNLVPADIPNKNWNLWGVRMKLTKDSVYPIRTYMQHIEAISRPTIPLFIDPLAGLMEVMSKLQPNEQIWIQLFIRPVQDDWTDQSKKIVEELMEKVTKVQGEDGTGVSVTALSPGEREIINAVELKATKKAYETKVQFVYLGRNEIFSLANVGATMGLFNQFASLTANSLKPDSSSMTKANYLFAKQRKIYKQRKLIRMMRARSFWERGYILNIEELASLFHFPTKGIKAPMTPWLESRKGGPPLGLPV